ncbi:FecR family protein [Pedobacter sp. Hv1]|uniref:FecR family protein n=1 Tax=Pedobacter sp. Hv1 TaxID=1740090 RepID=UPI0006D8948B|nr:FecR family protein [Pedobacter sp. Hv1]KQC00673.1 hypothetical protein AQF98_08305 [Pedobacter sp. Hv1]
MSGIDINKLLDRYINGNASAFEQEVVENWLLTQDQEPSAWEQMDENSQKKWLKTVFERIETTLDEKKVVQLSPPKKWWKNMVAVAAIITAFLVIFSVWPYLAQEFAGPNLVSLKMPEHTKQQITLSDGSRVWINAGSELKYSSEFSGSTREVYLNGEAYFDIKKDPKRPFIVHTGKLTTTVLGTAFNIKTDPKNNQIKVTVTRGKVKVSKGKQTLGLLIPNQQIVYNTTSQTYQQYKVDAIKSINWLPSDLFFDNATFGEAAKILGERFNVKIEFANEQIKNCRFSGTAMANREIEDILEVICKFNNSTYKRERNTITIFGNGCN